MLLYTSPACKARSQSKEVFLHYAIFIEAMPMNTLSYKVGDILFWFVI